MAKEYLIINTPATDGELTEEHLELLSFDGWNLVSVHESREFDENKYYFVRDNFGSYRYDKGIWKKLIVDHLRGLISFDTAIRQLETSTEISNNEE